MTDEDKGAPPAPSGSLWRTLKMVAWSFVGIRKSSEYKEDLARVNPLHVILVAIAAVLVFVVGLVFFVHWVVGR